MAAAAKEPKKQRVFGVKTFSFGSSTRSVGVAFVVVCSPHRPRFRRLLSKVPKASIQLKEEEKKRADNVPRCAHSAPGHPRPHNARVGYVCCRVCCMYVVHTWSNVSGVPL